MLDTFIQDLVYGLRILRKSPSFTTLIIATLALGIGVNTAIFSIVDAVLIRPLPYPDAGRLVLTFDAPARDQEKKIFVPYRHFLQWNKQNRSYSAMAAESWIRGPRFLLGRGAPKSILAAYASEGFFSVLGVAPQVGRAFAKTDLSSGCTVVLSHRFWQTRLGGDPSITRQNLALDELSCSVIGVMPSDFTFYPTPTDMWILIKPDSEFDRNQDRNGVAVIGRLKPGVSQSAAQAELRVLARSIDQGRAFDVEVEPVSFDLKDEFTWLAGRNLRLSILVLFGAVCFVLLIACVNVANLLVARGLTRQREFAIRVALGSGRARLIRQLITESLLLSGAAALLGVGIAAGAVRVLTIVNPVELPPGAVLHVNGVVLLFTVALVLLTTTLFGFAPSWQASRPAVGEALKSGSRSSADLSRKRFAKGLIAAEITLSIVLLTGAALLIQSTINFAAAPLGLKPAALLTMTLDLPPNGYAEPPQRLLLFEKVRNHLKTIHGVERVGMSSRIALKGSFGISALQVQGRPAADPRALILDTERQSVSDGYFRSIGIAFQRGREFSFQDRAGTLPVAIVNDALVKKYFGGEDPLGKQIRFPGSPTNPWLTIVGVASNEKQSDTFHEMAWAAGPIVYRPLAQQTPSAVDLAVQLSNVPSLETARIERDVQSVSQDLRVSDVHTLQEVVDRYTAYPRFRAVLMGSFAGLALILAIVGLYGVLAQMVVQRTQEIGIRMALGAQVRDVVNLILKEGMLLTAIGACLGLLAAWALMRFLQSLLFGVAPHDPLTLACVVFIFAVAAFAATCVPARRAARVDPVDSLRAD